MSPEQLRGETVDARSDLVFATGLRALRNDHRASRFRRRHQRCRRRGTASRAARLATRQPDRSPRLARHHRPQGARERSRAALSACCRAPERSVARQARPHVDSRDDLRRRHGPGAPRAPVDDGGSRWRGSRAHRGRGRRGVRLPAAGWRHDAVRYRHDRPRRLLEHDRRSRLRRHAAPGPLGAAAAIAVSEPRARRPDPSDAGEMGRPSDASLTPELAEEVYERVGATAALDGSIAALGSQYVIGLRARNCATGDVLAEEQVQAARKEDVLDALSRVATAFRTRVGESLATVTKYSTPLQEATTSSLEASEDVHRSAPHQLVGGYDQGRAGLSQGPRPRFGIRDGSRRAWPAYSGMGETGLTVKHTRSSSCAIGRPSASAFRFGVIRTASRATAKARQASSRWVSRPAPS